MDHSVAKALRQKVEENEHTAGDAHRITEVISRLIREAPKVMSVGIQAAIRYLQERLRPGQMTTHQKLN